VTHDKTIRIRKTDKEAGRQQVLHKQLYPFLLLNMCTRLLSLGRLQM
jgi:hypothetical protein